MNKERRTILVEPVFQFRFVLFLMMVTLITGIVAMSIIYVQIVVPASVEVDRYGTETMQGSRSLSRLMEISSDTSLPDEQRTALLRAEVNEIARQTNMEAFHMQQAYHNLNTHWPYVTTALIIMLISIVWGLFWSRRFIGAEMGILRRLEGLVDGDLHSHPVLRKHDELHYLRRGVVKLTEEMRSIVRTDRQLIAETTQTVEQMLAWIAREENLSQASRDRLIAVVEKVREMERLTERFRF